MHRIGALAIRWLFERDAAKTKRAMERHRAGGIAVESAIPYREGDRDALLDLYRPAGETERRLPLIVWIHGGAWLSGHRDDAAPYLTRLAAAGHAVIAPGYSLAPRHRYPLPVHQLNDAFAFIRENAARLGVDPDRVVIAGDSSGAQLASQISVLTTSPSYAAMLGIEPALPAAALRAVVLNCGIYDMAAFLDTGEVGSRALVWGVDTVARAYTGSRTKRSPVLKQMSTLDHLTADFPPALISGGNGDPLTDTQSRPLAARLEQLGVPVETLFFGPDRRPELPHEYQFDLDSEAGQEMLRRTLEFATARLAV